ncbi:MAG: Lsr2 family protein [Promicromonosporaceae bacterium]|nr:Lsr2 family protein [Promicromonosporaceae bacterium]
MVQKTQIVLIDDIDGGNADETVTFGLDGVSYEIDLSAAHAAELREGLARWVAAGRKAGRVATVLPRGTATRRASADRAQLAKIREWARDNDLPVSDRGRISADIMAKFQAAH